MPYKVCGWGLDCFLMMQAAGVTAAMCPNWRRCGGLEGLWNRELDALDVRYIIGRCDAAAVERLLEGGTRGTFLLYWEQARYLLCCEGENVEGKFPDLRDGWNILLEVNSPVYLIRLLPKGIGVRGRGWGQSVGQGGFADEQAAEIHGNSYAI
jgi:hypothetical protein